MSLSTARSFAYGAPYRIWTSALGQIVLGIVQGRPADANGTGRDQRAGRVKRPHRPLETLGCPRLRRIRNFRATQDVVARDVAVCEAYGGGVAGTNSVLLLQLLHPHSRRVRLHHKALHPGRPVPGATVAQTTRSPGDSCAAIRPLVTKIFSPLRIHSRPSSLRGAVVRILAVSLPACGSVIAMAPHFGSPA